MMPNGEPRIHARTTDTVGMTLCGMTIVFTPFEEDHNNVFIDRVVGPPRLDEMTCKICLKHLKREVAS